MNKIYKNLSLNNLPNEEWLPIVGYEGLYQVSSYGRVKSLGNDKTRKEKILRQGKNNKTSYLYVALWKEGKVKTCTVHRLVATAFIDNPSNLPCVNHKDEVKTNNCVGNLEWCTYQYNLNFGTCQAKRVANIDYKARTANTDWKAKVANTDYKAISRKNAEKLSLQV